MATNEFLLKIEGPGVAPETVDIGDLADLLESFRAILVAISGEFSDSSDGVSLSLVRIEAGSDKLTLSASPTTIRAAGRFCAALASNSCGTLPSKSHTHIRKIWKTLDENGWERFAVIGNGSAIGEGSISRSHELFPEVTTYRGVTTIYGQCVRIGGPKKPKAEIKLLNDQIMKIDLKSREMAQLLGRKLYQVVGLTGEASWSVETSEMTHFIANELTGFTDRTENGSTRTIVQSLESLAKSAGIRWNDINPDVFIQNQRRD